MRIEREQGTLLICLIKNSKNIIKMHTIILIDHKRKFHIALGSEHILLRYTYEQWGVALCKGGAY